MPIRTRAIAVHAPGQPLKPWTFQRRDPGPRDVAVSIAFCGICHSDLHEVQGDIGSGHYPLTPGHEITGIVTEVGSDVTAFVPGDRVGIGCVIDSCRTCGPCRGGEEQYCLEGMTQTYGSFDKMAGTVSPSITQEGFSTAIVVDERYVLKIPDALSLSAAAPLLCAGVTTYSPLRRWGAGPGVRVAVVGFGGLGHLALKLAVAMGATVTVFDRAESKRADADRMGASDFVSGDDPKRLRDFAEKFDLILSSVPGTPAQATYVEMLAFNGVLVLLGLTSEGTTIYPRPLLWRRRSIAGSLMGGIRETQEMLLFCAEHGVTPEVEIIPPDGINAAFARMQASDVRFRFVVDFAQSADQRGRANTVLEAEYIA